MRVVIVGGGPAGLYLAVLLRHVDPGGEVVVLERQGPGGADGWGIELPAAALASLRAANPATYDYLAQRFVHFDDSEVHVRGRRLRSHGHGLVGISRAALLRVLAERADALGAEIRYHTEILDDAALEASGLGDADLVVFADGAESVMRARHAEHFGPVVETRPTRVLWLGTTRRFDALTFLVVETEHGVVHAQAFPSEEGRSTFIVQCDEGVWQRLGMSDADGHDVALHRCETLFASWLDGHPLLRPSGTSREHDTSRRFTCVENDHWHHDRYVLLGDAAHTTHFAGRHGTRLAMEDALALACSLNEHGASETALAVYEAERKAEALRWQRSAREAMDWFEHIDRALALPAEQFAYALVTRTEGLGHERLRERDPLFVQMVERAIARQAGLPDASPQWRNAPPPMFTPLTLRDLTLANRVVVAPVDLHSATDGRPDDFHLAHYTARALGGAGLLVTETTAVSPDGRVSPGSTGIYRADQADAWRRIASLVHRTSPAKLCLQLGHAGPKGARKRPWHGRFEPLGDDAWEIIAPSAIPFRAGLATPRAMTREDMTRVVRDFVDATRFAVHAEFDMLELHAAHGQLLSAFLTPLLNRRTDAYGGSRDARLRFPLEVFSAVRDAWPDARPISVCISATDGAPDGNTEADGVAIARAFRDAGADVIHVSAGHTSPDERMVHGRMFLTPLSDRVRNEAPVPTIAVGNITDADQVNSIIASGRADLCALGRAHLTNPSWTLHAAMELGYAPQGWPSPYEGGRRQLARELEHRIDMFEADAT
jgi:anthraniloyl-CoA monooxygenase